MNATSRAILQTVVTSDASLSEAEQQAMNRLLKGEHGPVETLPDTLSVTQKQAAKLLSVSRVTVWRMAKENLLHPVELLPGTWRYAYAEIAALSKFGWQGHRHHTPGGRSTETAASVR